MEFGENNSLEILKIDHAMSKIDDQEFSKLKNEILNTETPEFPVLGQDIKGLNFSGKIIGTILSQLHNKWEESDYQLSEKDLLKLVRCHHQII